MIGFLRFVGILNAAVWCGSAIFLAVGLPAVFSSELKQLLTVPGVGFAAEALVARFFVVQYWCGAIGLAHLAAEWLYAGRPVRSLDLGLVTGLLVLALAGGLWVQPKMQGLHKVHYFGKTAEQRDLAGKTFAVWHGSLESVNLLVIGSLIFYLWRVSGTTEHARFGNFTKIRG
ncbi:MAG TPA: DUF4149 domain-containing protein [Candidatus Baltobacteraceae bacterium]|nr:DUF4149 domain-containing protein [Candidatus Baltobacteraceae bacterium]